MSALSRCAFSEGSVALPEGYADRTVNVLLAGDDVSPQSIFPAMRCSRRKTEGYVTRQLDALAQGLKGWAFKAASRRRWAMD